VSPSGSSPSLRMSSIRVTARSQRPPRPHACVHEGETTAAWLTAEYNKNTWFVPSQAGVSAGKAAGSRAPICADSNTPSLGLVRRLQQRCGGFPRPQIKGCQTCSTRPTRGPNLAWFRHKARKKPTDGFRCADDVARLIKKSVECW